MPEVSGGSRLPSALAPADRKLLAGAAGLALILLALSVVFAPPGEQDSSGVPSSYSSGSGGARAAYLLLEQMNVPVERWEESPSALPLEESGAVLILADPNLYATEEERKSLTKFVNSGGHVLFTGSSVGEFFSEAAVSGEGAGRKWAEFPALLPVRWTQGARTVTLEPRCVWTKLDAGQLALYGQALAPSVIHWSLGKGQVIWWASATPLTNAGIEQTGNLRLFLNSVLPAANGRVYWDEYFHGERASLWSYVEKTAIKWGLVQLGVLTGFVLFAFSRRWGPIASPRPISRLSPLEFVDTLGGLYQRAGATAVPVRVSYRNLRLKLLERLGLQADISDPELVRNASDRLWFDAAALAGTLDKAGLNQSVNLRPAEALGLVKDLENMADRLRTQQHPAEKD